MKTEPILTAWLATAVVWLAGYFGLDLSPEVTTMIAGGHLVTPTRRPRITRAVELVERSAAAVRQALAEMEQQRPPST